MARLAGAGPRHAALGGGVAIEGRAAQGEVAVAAGGAADSDRHPGAAVGGVAFEATASDYRASQPFGAHGGPQITEAFCDDNYTWSDEVELAYFVRWRPLGAGEDSSLSALPSTFP